MGEDGVDGDEMGGEVCFFLFEAFGEVYAGVYGGRAYKGRGDAASRTGDESILYSEMTGFARMKYSPIL